MRRPTTIVLTVLTILLATSCQKDEAQKTYSTKYPVRCNFYVPTYTQLFNAMAGYGQYVTVRQTTDRQSGTSVIQMSDMLSTDNYAIDATMRYFNYGLGGLIIGMSTYTEPLAFDLACPNCDRAERRLSLKDDGTAVCSKCGITYDLNNYGFIRSVPDQCQHLTPRGLYRYHITFYGDNVSVYN